MGDFNAKIGEGQLQDVVGQFGLGVRNDRGDRLVQFCQEESMVVMNTFFKLPPRRLYTWKSPADSPTNIVRNQIDFILVHKRYRNSFKSVKTYPGADIGSDHNPLVGVFNIKLKKLTAPSNMHGKIDVSKLRDKDTRNKLHCALHNKFHELKETDKFQPLISSPEQVWKTVKEVILDTAKESLVPTAAEKSKEWITDEILNLMTQRRLVKHTNPLKYKEIHKEIGRKCIEAKDQWINNKCTEIETLQAKHDTFNMYKKINDLMGLKRKPNGNTLLDKDNNYAMNIEDRLRIWKDYIEDLFHDQRSNHINASTELIGPRITKDEVFYAIKSAKNGKSVGPDEIPAEILKLLEYEHLDVMVNFFNSIYDTGIIPSDWLHSIFITLPKISTAKRCNEYRTISLTSHVLKIFLKIIHKRIYRKCEENISETQFGFRNGYGTRDALFAYQVLMQRCWDMNQSIYICFIDYEKAFDRVKHDKLIQILEKVGLDSKDVSIIKNLYWQQTANVRVEHKLTADVEILRGVRQGCVLSPLLFNLYAEEIFSEALENATEGIVVNGRPLNNIRYADDTVLLASCPEDLQKLINCVASTSARNGLNINIKKTKYMVVGRSQISANLSVNNQPLERVSSYKYLGCIVNEQEDHSVEVRCRIEQARAAFVKMRHLLCNRNLKLSTRCRLVRCYIISILLYGVEAWTLTKTLCKRLEAFEMWIYRRMLKISWTDRVKNETVLQRMHKRLELLNTIKKRKLQYLGHIMRNEKYALLQLILQGKIQGKRRPGRRRTHWLQNLAEWFNMSTIELFRAATSRAQVAIMIADLR